MGFLKNMFRDEDEYENGYDEVDQAFEQTTEKVKSAAPQRHVATGSTMRIVNATGANEEVFNIMSGIINNVRANEAVIVNLKHLKAEDKISAYHILKGATQALDAKLKPLNDDQLIMAPEGWDLLGEIN